MKLFFIDSSWFQHVGSEIKNNNNNYGVKVLTRSFECGYIHIRGPLRWIGVCYFRL